MDCKYCLKTNVTEIHRCVGGKYMKLVDGKFVSVEKLKKMAGKDLITRARDFAIESHKDTKYGDLPYDYHLKAVVGELKTKCLNISEYEEAAAWLHDVVEDTDVTIGDIREEFGGTIANLVDAVTDEPGDNRKIRKAGMYKKLAIAKPGARSIKLADRLANTKASIENPGRAKMYRDEFPEFIKKAGQDYENKNIVLELFFLYIDSQLAARVEASKLLDESLEKTRELIRGNIEKSGRTIK